MERIFANQSAVVHICVKFLTQRTFNCSGVFQRLNRRIRRGSHGKIERVEQVSVPVLGIFYGDVRRGGVPVAPVNRSSYAVNVKNQPELRMRLILLDVASKQRTPFAGDTKTESELIRVIGTVR
ncbi:Uncharacterised protein [Shigella sonnei]|nr:Uncharacterised protein [Shigella sonnei]CSF67298.1 Uncharacterised protein [Shigella sonnei]CSF73754.1 Uncharacterised protein [Shigella sonnei]CSF81981.1 Uncharacterised protein [Shigella sonnei]CSF96237.1 Uncharacterised protein [Shigella sonnei]